MNVSNVPNELNDPKDNILLSPFATDNIAKINTATPTPLSRPHAQLESSQRNDLEKRNLHIVITFVMLALFSFIIVYGLYMQNWWLVGILAVPLIRKAMYKIFDRHL